MRRLSRIAAVALTAAGAIILCYCAWAVAERWYYQRTRARAFDRALGTARTSGAAHEGPKHPFIRYGEVFGRIRIDRLGLSVMVAEGDDEDVLRHAAGHISGTAMPGSPGNVGIAAHRDSLFRGLRRVRLGDLIDLDTLQGEFRYRVTSIRIVAPTDVQVLGASRGQTLTLVTCYPFYYVGAAPKRFIVGADRLGHGNPQAPDSTAGG